MSGAAPGFLEYPGAAVQRRPAGYILRPFQTEWLRPPVQSPAFRNLRQKRCREIRVFKEAVKICPHDPPDNRAICSSIGLCQEWPRLFDVCRSAHVDFVSANCRSEERLSVGLDGDLFCLDFCFDRKEIKTCLGSSFLHVAGICDTAAKHLISTTDSDNPAALFQCRKQHLFEPGTHQPAEISDRVFCSRNNDQIKEPVWGWIA